MELDAVMRFAYERIMPERLIQTRVPNDLAKKIDEVAKREGETVAAWVRRLLFRQFQPDFIEAWTHPAGGAPRDDGVTSRAQPQFKLRPLRDISASDRVFIVHDRHGVELLPASLAERGAPLASTGRWIMLRGSPVPWEVVAQYVIGPVVEVTLRPVR